MNKGWLKFILQGFIGKPTSPSISPEQNFHQILVEYEHAINGISNDSLSLLNVLLIRDQVEDVQNQLKNIPLDQAQQLVSLDNRLRSETLNQSLNEISNWRQSFHPPESYWWWYQDEVVAEKEKEKDLLWELLAVTLFVLTIPLVTDIIKRLWAHAPDNFAIVSSLLLLLVTASPFTNRGRELVQWILKRLPRLPSHRRAEAMAMTALSALVLVAVVRFIVLPQIAYWYNNNGVIALEQGELTTAKLQFQRAVAINKDFAVSYYNLADVYEKVAQPDESFHWYQQAIAHNLEFSPAYNNLGRLYLQENQPERALTILQAGLARLDNDNSDPTETSGQSKFLTRYRLLTHLGQAHYELEQTETAVQKLKQAIALEKDDTLDAAFYVARPHYYLALAYEKLGYPADDIFSEWEAALSYLTDDDPVDWELTIREHKETWSQNNP